MLDAVETIFTLLMVSNGNTAVIFVGQQENGILLNFKKLKKVEVLGSVFVNKTGLI